MKLNIICYLFLLPKSNVKFKICTAISRWKGFINTKYSGCFSSLPWGNTYFLRGEEESPKGEWLWGCGSQGPICSVGHDPVNGPGDMWRFQSPRTLKPGVGHTCFYLGIVGHRVLSSTLWPYYISTPCTYSIGGWAMECTCIPKEFVALNEHIDINTGWGRRTGLRAPARSPPGGVPCREWESRVALAD